MMVWLFGDICIFQRCRTGHTLRRSYFDTHTLKLTLLHSPTHSHSHIHTHIPTRVQYMWVSLDEAVWKILHISWQIALMCATSHTLTRTHDTQRAMSPELSTVVRSAVRGLQSRAVLCSTVYRAQYCVVQYRAHCPGNTVCTVPYCSAVYWRMQDTNTVSSISLPFPIPSDVLP
jgi:hypothetical protein